MKSLRTILGLAIVSLLWSCNNDQEISILNPETPKINGSYELGQAIILGKKNEIVYSVENMKMALNNLNQSGRLAEDVAIETTHLYVRFLPSDTLELAILEEDSTLDLYDHPLEYEFEVDGDWYHDPDIPSDQPTWQYTVVEKDYNFPEITYEIMEELFFGDEEDSEEGRSELHSWYALEDEAMRITGQLEENDTENGWGSRWTPNGRIRVDIEGILGPFERTMPVRGVKVRARRGLKLRTAHTNSGGWFRMSSRFSGSVKYSIEWETHNYKVTNWWGTSINKHGPKIKGSYNPRIFYNYGDVHWAGATMVNAIYDFKQQARIYGIKQPSGATNVKLRPVFNSNGAVVSGGHYRHSGNAPFVFGGNTIIAQTLIRLILKNDVRFNISPDDDTSDIYATMMHELGHMSHVLESPVNFQLSWQSDKQLVESWASAVEYYFTLPYFSHEVNSMKDATGAEIVQGHKDAWRYTPIFIDMIDDTNQRNSGLDRADDDVENYTLKQIQSALNNRTSMRGVEDHLRNNHSNPSERHLTKLRAFYNTLKP